MSQTINITESCTHVRTLPLVAFVMLFLLVILWLSFFVKHKFHLLWNSRTAQSTDLSSIYGCLFVGWWCNRISKIAQSWAFLSAFLLLIMLQAHFWRSYSIFLTPRRLSVNKLFFLNLLQEQFSFFPNRLLTFTLDNFFDSIILNYLFF